RSVRARSSQEDCDVEKLLAQIYQVLQKMIGLHRQLLELVRLEREALVQANLMEIQNHTCAKQVLVEAIHQAEKERQNLVVELAGRLKVPPQEFTLPNIIIAIQGNDSKRAEQYRSAFNALTILIQRISEQNQD